MIRIKKSNLFYCLAIGFTIGFGLQPLYFSNQNTKFLKGFVNAGYGELTRDFIGQTIDPLPIFTWLVETIMHLQLPIAFYGFAISLTFIYAYFSFKIANKLFNLSGKQLWWFAFFFLLLHAPIIDDDIYWGFSDQYLFTQYFQPSSFAVLYLPAIYYFLKRRLFVCAFLMGIPGLFHAAYTLVGAILFVSLFSYLLLKEQKFWIIIGSGLLFSAVMLPAVFSQINLLTSTSDGLTEEAMRIISQERIPHHTKLSTVFSIENLLKFGFGLLSLLMLKNKEYKWMIGWLSGFIVLSLLFAYFSQNSTVTVSTPWRFSVLYVPLVLLAILGLLTTYLSRQKWVVTLNPFIPFLYFGVSVFGMIWTQNQFNQYKNREGMDVIYWIKANANQFNQATFLVHNKADYSERFRLETGLPIYVNWKTHPYKDIEVIEWYNRVQKNDSLYNAKQWEKSFFIQNNITHAIVENSSQQCEFCTPIYRGKTYKIVATQQ